MRIGCNTPGCVSKEGMNPMVNPGSNEQTFRCSRCGCEIVILEELPQVQASSFSSKGEPCPKCKKGMMMDDVCPDKLLCHVCGYTEALRAKSKCLHLHGFYLEGGAKLCNDCAQEV